jgi:hypothetical protein
MPKQVEQLDITSSSTSRAMYRAVSHAFDHEFYFQSREVKYGNDNWQQVGIYFYALLLNW